MGTRVGCSAACHASDWLSPSRYRGSRWQIDELVKESGDSVCGDAGSCSRIYPFSIYSRPNFSRSGLLLQRRGASATTNPLRVE